MNESGTWGATWGDRSRARFGGVAFALALSLALAALAPRIARADSPGDAKSLFALGRDLRAHGDCAGALPVFRSVYVIYPTGLGSLRNMAECEEAIGQFAAARSHWGELLRALGNSHESKYAGWAEDAAQGAARAAARMGTLIADVVRTTPGRAGGDDAIRVTLNGEALPASLWSTPLARDPGRYVFRIQAGGGVAPEDTVVFLGPGDTHRVLLHPPSVPVLASIGPSFLATESGTSDSGPSTARRDAAWATFSVGVAGFLGSGIAFILRQSAMSDLASQCPNYQTEACPESVRTTVDRGKTANTVAEALAIVGTAGVATGVVLWATAPAQREGGATAALRLVPEGLLASGSF